MAIGLHLAVAAILAISGGFTELAILSSLATVVVYAVSCVAAVRLQWRGVALAGPPLRVPGLWAAAAVGLAAMVWIGLNARPSEALGCGGAIVLAAAWYGAATWMRRRGRIGD